MEKLESLKLLQSLGISEKKIKQFKKKNIESLDDLLMYFPKHYYDYTHFTGLDCERVCVCVYIEDVRSGISGKGIHYIFASGLCGGTRVSVGWFNSKHLLSDINKRQGKDVVVAGKCDYDPEKGQYSIIAPDLFTEDRSCMQVFPEYPKVPGMSDVFLKDCIRKALFLYASSVNGYLPYPAQRNFMLPSFDEALYMLHKPSSMKDVALAKKRLLYDDLYLFASIMEKDKQWRCLRSHVKIKSTERTSDFIRSLPYSLTEDQYNTIAKIYEDIEKQRCVHALVQGDVGCGKTIVAAIIASTVAENGYQAALLAPTSVLAKQHYEDLRKSLFPVVGDRVLFVPSLTSMRKKERESLKKKISSGEGLIMIGTHSLLSDDIEFHDLGLVITDEEHKFGVEQREALLKKASGGAHYITMSATPIPRSLAGVLYGESSSVFSIKSMPKGREPVQTAVNHSWRSCFDFIKKQIDNGRQAYVVCPQVDINPNQGNIDSVKSLTEKYEEYFGKGIVEGLSGKTSRADTARILESFKNNELKILVATTVIEVGVNVPNANTIIIHNAERFGLAGLHQLRGRVGRGGGKAYCILFSEDKANPRLLAMCRTNNGFDIAEEDLKLRGAGELIGTAQSGISKYTDQVLKYPDDYRKVKGYMEYFIS